jgi:hypothetical protein
VPKVTAELRSGLQAAGKKLVEGTRFTKAKLAQETGEVVLRQGRGASKSADDFATVYHFTDKKGFNAITSGKDITIKANKPPGNNPTGASFSKKRT